LNSRKPVVGKSSKRSYQYRPTLELHAEVGRKLSLGTGGELTHMLFTKKADRQSIGVETDVDHEDILADVEIRVSARQGPQDPEEKKHWFERIRGFYRGLGYESRVFYRHAKGRTLSGQVHAAEADAADLLRSTRLKRTLPIF
jgi:hypothetical protein